MPCLWIAGEKNYCWEQEPGKKMEALIDGSEAIRNAGYKLICLSNLAEEKQQVNKMKFIQGKEEQNND